MSVIGEALAAPAGIAGLISLGIVVGKALYFVAASIGAAGQEVRQVALEVEMYTRTMEVIKDVLSRQDNSAPRIIVVIERLVGICHPIFKMYDDIQKSLVPLLERFRDSKKKLEQINLRFMWYFRSKRKVYACRAALKRQFDMLTPILLALGIDQSGSKTQNNYHVQNVHIRVVLENSAAGIESLHNSFGNGLRQLYLADQPPQGLLPPAEGPSRGSTEPGDVPATGEPEQDKSDTGANTAETASTAADSNSRSALVRYQPPNGDEDYLSPDEVEEIDRQVEETLDRVIETVPDADIEDIILETYSVEKQFIQLMQQILVGLAAGGTRANSGDGGRPSEEHRPRTPRPEDPGVQPREIIPTSETTNLGHGESWVIIMGLDGLQYKFPYDMVNHPRGLFDALRRTGSIEWGGYPVGKYDKFDRIEQILDKNRLFLVDTENTVIFLTDWERLLKPGMRVRLQRKAEPYRVKGLLRELFSMNPRRG